MACWIFKTAEQDLYPDKPGEQYTYDNRHSLHVARGDLFVYLDKSNGRYGFIGHGVVASVSKRKPENLEVNNEKIKTIYTANLLDVMNYSMPLDIRTFSPAGKRNRKLLGITDVNKLGWSRSMPRLDSGMFDKIVSLAYQNGLVLLEELNPHSFEIPDVWTQVRKRHSLELFRKAILERQNYVCCICGTGIRELLEVAHVSPYSSDKENRANPANGIGLCVFCHTAYDRRLLWIYSDGKIQCDAKMSEDRVAQQHITALTQSERAKLLSKVDIHLLKRRNDELSESME